MRNIILGISSVVLLLLIILITSTIFGRNARKNELRMAMNYSMEQALNACGKTDGSAPKSNDELVALFTENLTEQINSKSSITIEILQVDLSKRLLSAKCTLYYNHLNGRLGSVSVTDTVITEQTPSKNQYVQCTFQWQMKGENMADDEQTDLTQSANYYIQEDEFIQVPPGKTWAITHMTGLEKNEEKGQADTKDITSMELEKADNSSKQINIGDVLTSEEISFLKISNVEEYYSITFTEV